MKKHISDRQRFSVVTSMMSVCIECGRPSHELHECFCGRNRQKSKDYGLVVPLCADHHRMAHRNPYNRRKYEQMGKAAFLKDHTIEEFKEIFGRYYE